MDLVDNAKAIAMKSAGITLHFRQRFKGRLQYGSGVPLVGVRLAFFAHESSDGNIWRQFASVEFGNGQVISTWQNNVNVGKGLIKSDFMFNFSGRTYYARAEMRLENVTDLLIGLDIKTANIVISTKGGSEETAVFTQPIKARIKNAFYLYVKAEKSWWGKLLCKRRILKTVFK